MLLSLKLNATLTLKDDSVGETNSFTALQNWLPKACDFSIYIANERLACLRCARRASFKGLEHVESVRSILSRLSDVQGDIVRSARVKQWK